MGPSLPCFPGSLSDFGAAHPPFPPPPRGGAVPREGPTRPGVRTGARATPRRRSRTGPLPAGRVPRVSVRGGAIGPPPGGGAVPGGPALGGPGKPRPPPTTAPSFVRIRRRARAGRPRPWAWRWRCGGGAGVRAPGAGGCARPSPSPETRSRARAGLAASSPHRLLEVSPSEKPVAENLPSHVCLIGAVAGPECRGSLSQLLDTGSPW